MYERAAIVGLYAETPLHPGQGSASGVVDLPVARERHLDFPIIPGSTLKGVLRAQARRVWGQSERLLAVFGPDTDHAGDHAGALAFSDARLLLFPVRSLRGVFAWTTGPLALDRYRRDLAAAGLQAPWQVPVPLAGQAFATRPSAVIAEGQIMLEEFTFEAQERPEVTAIAEDLARNLFPASAEYEPWRRRVERQLVVLTDDDFSDFVQTATEVVARIRINPTTGAADDGGLWYEEYVPSEALGLTPLSWTQKDWA